MYHLIPSLKKGDKIGICCTARFVTKEAIQPCLNTLEEWGFEVVLGKYIFEKDRQFGGNDTQRTHDLQAFLDDPEIKAVLFAKGGYGTVRIVDGLSWDGFKNNPKWLCGFSDITVLHAHVHQQVGLPSLHSPMSLNFQPNSVDVEALQRLKDFWEGKGLEAMIAKPHSNNRFGSSEGVLVGGNLSILYSISGSDSELDLDGKILFLEDLDEYLYHIDRMLWQLKRAGKLKGLAGLVVGGMSEMKDNAEPFGRTVEEIVREAVGEYGYPVAFGLEAGHIFRNLPLALGLPVQLTVNEAITTLKWKN
ncbi:MAG: LD-carboxypeptidase [Bacteroidia bacterium]|nr:LD-carboxypeptidase [Bacteroidia bacterium]